MNRRFFAALVAAIMGARATRSWAAFKLDYDALIMLDAEELAETGIKSAYDKLRPALRKYIASPADVQERIDHDAPTYSVVCQGREYAIYGKGSDEYESWGIATFAFFDIVNRQLAGTRYRFFAIEAGNDLGGMFLTPEDAEAAKKTLPRKTDWPYLPQLKGPWYGQNH